ncbi:MAG: anaerobic ribonucleoside-triphosphate reductase, partial [Victivallaceae bacterium]
ILYRANREKVRTGKQLMMDIQELVSSYIEQQDWRVNENSNSGYSYASLLNHVSGTVVANYTLSNIYPEEISQAHVSGDFHLHDLSCGIVGYCAGWSLRQLLQMGFVGCGGRASAAPAKHFDTALGQIVNFLSTLQTEWAGAQAFNSFDTLLAPFVRHDQLSYTQIKQAMQQFVFGLNIASRWGQTPFTNLTFDWVVPEDLADQAVIIGGQVVDGEYYRDFQTEMDLINRAFLEVMSVGDRDGRIFTFPIPTYNITRNFNWDSSNAKLLFKVTGKYGLP